MEIKEEQYLDKVNRVQHCKLLYRNIKQN